MTIMISIFQNDLICSVLFWIGKLKHAPKKAIIFQILQDLFFKFIVIIENITDALFLSIDPC